MLRHETIHPLIHPVPGTDLVYLPHVSRWFQLTNDVAAVISLYRKNPSINLENAMATLGLPVESLKKIKQQLLDLNLIDNNQIELNIHQPTSLSVYIELTEACNFSCSGCATAVDINSETAQHMTPEYLGQQLENIYRAAQLHGFNRVKLKYAGGEPLLPVITPLITGAQSQIQELGRKYQLETDQVVLTNGVFLERQLPLLDNVPGLRFAVSIWGLPETNHQVRSGRAKKDSYQQIQRGLWSLAAKRNGFNVQHTITPTNAKDFPQFLETMWDTRSDQFIGKNQKTHELHIHKPIPLSFSIFRPQNKFQLEQLHRISGYNQITDGILAGISYAEKLINQGVIPSSFLVNFDYINLGSTKLTTCGSGINYIAIGPNKEPQACHQGLHASPRTTSIPPDVIAAANPRHTPVIIANQPLPDSLNRPEQILLALHGGGGCPLVNELEGGIGTAVEEVYAKIIPALLGVLARSREKEQQRE